jgi:hypothetical protein
MAGIRSIKRIPVVVVVVRQGRLATGVGAVIRLVSPVVVLAVRRIMAVFLVALLVKMRLMDRPVIAISHSMRLMA